MRVRPSVERLRLRRAPLAAAALWFAGGILAGRWVESPVVALLAVLLALALVSVVTLGRKSRVAWVSVGGLWVALGMAAAAWQPAAPLPHTLLGYADNLSRTVEGRVTRIRTLPPRVQIADADPVPAWERDETPEPEGESALSVDLAVDRVEDVSPDVSHMVAAAGGVRVTIYKPPAGLASLRCGDRLTMPLRMQVPDAYRDPGAFDYRAYLLQHDGVAARAGVAGDRVIRLGGTAATLGCRLSGAQTWAAGRIRTLVASPAMHRLPRAVRLNRDDGGMLSAMLFGDRTGLSQPLKLNFERTGTFHLFVVSGLHVALLAAGLFWMLRRLGVGPGLATAGTLAGATAYAAMTGFGQPAQRALAMTAMYLVVQLLARRMEPLNALGAATLAMLAWSPSSLFSASLQMTVLVIVAIAGIAVPLNRRLFGNVLAGAKDAWRVPRQSFAPAATHVRTLLEFWGEELGEVVGKWARMWPARLLVFLFSACELALMGIVTELILVLPMAFYFHRANVFALPANLLVLPMVGALAMLAVSTFVGALFSPWVALLPAAATAAMLHGLTWAIARIGEAGGAELRVPGPSLWVAGAAVAMWLGCCWAVRRGRWGAWGVAVALPMIAAMVLWPEPVLRSPGALELTAIDVGQGDSLFAVAPDGQTMLIDGGGPIGSHGRGEAVSQFDVGEQVVSPYLWTRRLRQLDVVVLTHAHTDHMGGLPAVLRNFRPRELWVGIDPGSELYRKLLAEAADLGVTVRHLHAGDRPKWGSVQVDVLAPAEEYRNQYAPKNDDSLVLRMRLGRASVLLEGDAERPSEDAMLAAGLVAPVTLLKVGHHGSKTSSNPEFLEVAHPRAAVMSVGRHNPFGHPYGAVVDRFAALGTHLFRTDEFGLTTFLLHADGSIQTNADGMALPQAGLAAQQVDLR